MKLFLLSSAAVAALLTTAMSASAQTASVVATAADAPMVSEVVVNGAGQTRQVQSITAVQVEEAVPGTSPIKLLQSLPGVNFESSDPFGSYEWATRISVRGFNQNALGFTLDGVPLGDMAYDNHNGLHISRAISSENLGTTQLSEGTGALGTASTSNLGGTIEFHSRAPDQTPGVDLAGTYGSYSTQHEYIRIDSGALPGGGAGYFSYSNQDSDKWKGEGQQRQEQVNAKFVQPLGPVTITSFIDYSDRAENDYQDLSLGLIKSFGYKLDNISNNFPLALAIANAYDKGTAYPAPFTNTPDAVDAVYYNSSGIRRDAIGAVKLDWAVNNDFHVSVNAYGHNDNGAGLWYTPYVASPNGVPISTRTTEYYIQREGVVSSADYKIAGHDIEAGLWYEHNNFNQARRFYQVSADGSSPDSLKLPTDPFATQWYGKFTTDTYVFHIQDNWKITDDLKLNYGFKTQSVDITAVQAIAGLASGEIKNSDGFLPQVGVNYNFHDYGEVFADYAKNMQALIGANTTGPFSTTQAGFDAIKGSIKPETSNTGELGYRYHLGGTFQATVVGYYVKFDNRLLTIPTGSAIVGSPNVLANVGSVTNKGVELSGSWKPITHWTLSGSYSFNDSTYDNNVVAAGATYDISGKTVVDAPKNIAYGALGYDDHNLFGSIDVSYLSKRYFSYENDASVPSHTVVDLTVGYRFDGPGLLKGVELQGNVYNLTNERYVATLGTNGFGFSGDNQTLQAGAPIEVFGTIRKKF